MDRRQRRESEQVTSARRTGGTPVLRRREGGGDHRFYVGEGVLAGLRRGNSDWGHSGELETKAEEGEREGEGERSDGERKRGR